MKLTKLAPLALLLAAAFAGQAQAQTKAAPPAAAAPAPGAPGNAAPPPSMPDPLSKAFHDCVQKVQDSAQAAKQPADPAAAQVCFVAETRQQEGKVSAGVQRMAKGLTPAEKKRLDDANVAWRRFRDLECAFFADPKGTPVESANNAQCVLDRTIKRAIDMESLAQAVTQGGQGGGAAGASAPPPPNAPAPAGAPPAKK